jgi:hypothetical protein
MKVFVECGYTDNELGRFTRVRCNHQVLFYFEVFDVGESALDRRYLESWPPGATWSTLIFLQESPPAKDYRIWQQALGLIAPRGSPQQHLGKFINKGHKIWEWRYDLENSRLYHVRGSVMDIYTPLLVPGHTRRANRWTRLRIDQPRQDFSTMCMVKEVALGVKSTVFYADCPKERVAPLTFWEVLRKCNARGCGKTFNG